MSRLVLVDDSTTIQKIVELAFAEEQVDVCSFADPGAALDSMVLEGADIILADITLPGVNGYELCRRIRLSPRLSEVPIVLLAGTFEPFDVQEAEESGYSGSLTKPFEATQLVTLVSELLNKDVSENGAGSAVVADLPAVDVERDVLFEVPLIEVDETPLFELTVEQCRPVSRRLPRIEDGETTVDPRQLETLVAKIIERLPAELERILPRLVREAIRDEDD